jgi:hypothetical protein
MVRSVPAGVAASTELAQAEGPETGVLIAFGTEIADSDERDVGSVKIQGPDRLASEPW